MFLAGVIDINENETEITILTCYLTKQMLRQANALKS